MTRSRSATSTHPPRLVIDGLGIAFGGVQALEQVSLATEPGMVLGLIGPNGAGKSTLFNCVMGLYRPDAGSVRFGDRDITGWRPHRIAKMGIARTFQNIELFHRLSVLDNILLGRHLHMRTGVLSGMLYWGPALDDEVRQRRRAEEILDLLDLQFARHELVMHLPYGIAKKVELARALALDPSLVLLDEPSAGMNAEEKEDLLFVIGDIKAQLGIGLVLVEHDLGMVMGVSDRVVVLDSGKKIADDTPAVVMKDAAVIEAYLGRDASSATPLASRGGAHE